jgi:endonuclease G, mitochondrial
MFEHFPQQRLRDLAAAVQQLPFTYEGASRRTILGGIDPAFTALFHIGLPPKLQLLSDLGELNRIERLADGSVPIVTWLRNVAFLAAGTPTEELALSMADEVSHQVTGAPRIANPATLPEFKEAIIHEDDMVSFQFMASGVDVAKSVAKVMVPRFDHGVPALVPGSGSPVVHLGTCWLLAADLLITNHHVVNARRAGEPPASAADFEQQARAASILFDFDDRGMAGAPAAVLALVGFDAGLDYALLKIAPTGRAPLRLAPARLQRPPDKFVPVNVVQHPAGQSKCYAIRNNLVSATTATDLRYFTDTTEGSSGSPVFDDGWQVVGLHRGSTVASGVKFQGRSTASVNLGTQIQAVVEDIRARYPNVTLLAV